MGIQTTDDEDVCHAFRRLAETSQELTLLGWYSDQDAMLGWDVASTALWYAHRSFYMMDFTYREVSKLQGLLRTINMNMDDWLYFHLTVI